MYSRIVTPTPLLYKFIALFSGFIIKYDINRPPPKPIYVINIYSTPVILT